MATSTPRWLTYAELIARDIGGMILFLLMIGGVVGLFYMGYRKIQEDKPTSASAALSFGFLLIVMLTVSQFKHVKGFGFDAETWDQKQVEAAQLVEQLQGLTKATTHELALVASKIGLWDNGPSNIELMGIIDDLTPVLKVSGFEKEQRDNLLAPLQKRIAYNYLRDASNEISRAFRQRYSLLEENPCRVSPDVPSNVTPYREKLCSLVMRIYENKPANMREIISLADEFPGDGKKELVNELVKFQMESQYFAAHGNLEPPDSDAKNQTK